MKYRLSIIFTALIILVVLGAAGCRVSDQEPDGTAEPISGRIYSIDDKVLLVVGGIDDVNIPRADWFEAGKRAVYFTVTADTVIEHAGTAVPVDFLARGQKVDVYHEGFLAESYPEQGSAMRVVIVDDTSAGEYRTDSGRFIRMIENKIIEIKISGVPDELPGRLFKITAEVYNQLQLLELEPEEVVLFHYLPDEETEGLIFDLNRLANQP